MTTFGVVWTPTAYASLARIVADDGNTPELRAASDRVDFVLRRLPLDVGESRSGNRRLWIGPVFGIFYSVYEDSKHIIILDVGLSRRH